MICLANLLIESHWSDYIVTVSLSLDFGFSTGTFVGGSRGPSPQQQVSSPELKFKLIKESAGSVSHLAAKLIRCVPGLAEFTQFLLSFSMVLMNFGAIIAQFGVALLYNTPPTSLALPLMSPCAPGAWIYPHQAPCRGSPYFPYLPGQREWAKVLRACRQHNGQSKSQTRRPGSWVHGLDHRADPGTLHSGRAWNHWGWFWSQKVTVLTSLCFFSSCQ